jgi:hypothetical protein
VVEDVFVIPDQIRRGSEIHIEEIRVRHECPDCEEPAKRMTVKSIAIKSGVRKVVVHPGPQDIVEKHKESLAAGWDARKFGRRACRAHGDRNIGHRHRASLVANEDIQC